MGGPLQHAPDIAEFDGLARIHHRDVIAEPPDDAEIVADEQEADALVASEARQQAQDLRLDRNVECSGRCIENQKRRIAGESRGDQRALLHPARQLVREGAGDFGGTIDPHLLQRDLGAAQRLGERQPEMLHHRFGDLPADAQRRIERRERALQHRADPPPEHLPPTFGSSTSRNPSPTRLMAMTVMLIAIPGASEIQGAVSTKARPLLIIKPQSAAGGCTPKPRKLNTAQSSTANTTRRLASTIRTGQTLGSNSRSSM